MTTLRISLLLALLVGCSSTGSDRDRVDTTLEITGTAGLQWNAAISDDDGIRSVEGTVPATLHLRAREGSFFGGTFQKDQAGDGSLQVCIHLNGRSKRCNATTAAFGVVSSQRDRRGRRYPQLTRRTLPQPLPEIPLAPQRPTAKPP